MTADDFIGRVLTLCHFSQDDSMGPLFREHWEDDFCAPLMQAISGNITFVCRIMHGLRGEELPNLNWELAREGMRVMEFRYRQQQYVKGEWATHSRAIAAWERAVRHFDGRRQGTDGDVIVQEKWPDYVKYWVNEL